MHLSAMQQKQAQPRASVKLLPQEHSLRARGAVPGTPGQWQAALAPDIPAAGSSHVSGGGSRLVPGAHAHATGLAPHSLIQLEPRVIEAVLEFLGEPRTVLC
jgi:hypothetical protein